MDFSKLTFPLSEYHSFIDVFTVQVKAHADKILINYEEEDGTYQSLSYRQVELISNNMACKFHQKYGVSGKNVSIMIDHSVQYTFLILAFLKLNCKVLLLSTRNSITALRDLIDKTNTEFVFHTARYKGSISEAVKDSPIKLFELPSTYDIKAAIQEPEIEEAKQILERKDKQDLEKIVFVIHSSGSTKFPKPIHLSNRYTILMSQTLHCFSLMAPSSIHFDKSMKFLSFAPMFHGMGVMGFFASIVVGGQFIFSLKYPPSTNDIVDSIHKSGPTLLLIPPLLLEQLAQHLQSHPNDWEYMKQLELVIYGGAALPDSVARYLLEGGINVKSAYGATEIGFSAVANLNPANLEHNILKFISPEQYIKLEKVPGSETLRKLFVRSDYPLLASGLPINEDGYYDTNDLWYETAPGSGLWRLSGRSDDVLIMLNGEKTNPLPMEEALRAVTDVIKACTVIGHGRECTAALIQLNVDKVMERNLQDIISEVKNAVEIANQDAPAHSKLVYPHMVKILPLKDSLPSTDKGVVSRVRSEAMYANDIEKMYSEFLSKGLSSKDASAGPQVQLTESEITDFLCQTVSKILRRSAELTRVDQNLFDIGFDSLMAIELRNTITKTIGDVPQNIIYEYPTIAELTQSLTSSKETSTHNKIAKQYQEAQDILAKYINRINQDFPQAAKTSSSKTNGGDVVLLTGATGSLGAFLLRDLIQEKSVTKIYALVRGNDLKGRLKKSFLSRGIDTSLLESSKVEALPMALTEQHLGLTDADFDRIQKEVTIICHCAWMLDFLQPLSYFDKECISGLYHLIEFAFKDGNNPMRIHFISSIGAAINIKPKVLEEPLPNDPMCAMPMGYSLSKYISEHLINYMTQNKNMPCYIERVGQMTGDSVNGAWNPQEQYPLMVAGGAVRLHKMPEMANQVDWIPYDYASALIVGIMTKTVGLPASLDHSIYHVVNPNTVSWNDYLQAIKESGLKFEIVKPSEWLKALSEDVENPAYKLISFYERMMRDDQEVLPVFSTTKAEQMASIIKKTPMIDSKLMRKFLQFWCSIKFIEAQ